MTEKQRIKGLKSWLKTIPESVQKLAREFPPDSVLVHGKDCWQILGYTEGDKLIVADVSIRDYDKAIAARKYICASHFRPRPREL